MIDLRDDAALLSEALAEHAEGRTDREGVYALVIDVGDGGHEAHARRWLRAGYDSTPPYLDAIVDAEEVVYVGRAVSVRHRIEEHLNGETRKASLLNVYDIRGILGVRWGHNTDHAERQYRDDLAAELGPDAYVHSR